MVGKILTCAKRCAIKFTGLWIVVVTTLSSCGYQFQGSGSILPPDVKRIYIPVVENYSVEPGLSLTVTEALRDRFDRFGVVTVVEDRRESDATLKVVIMSVKQDTSTTTSRTDSSLEVNTAMTVAGELRRNSGEVLWLNKGMTVTKPHGTTSDVVVTSSSDFASGGIGASDLDDLDSREVSRGQEQQALEQLAEETAKKIYDDAVAPDF